MIITIDGGAGTGKSTAARTLAATLGIKELNTGVLYRSVALLSLWKDVGPSDVASLVNLARTTCQSVRVDFERVWIGDLEVTNDIRSLECGQRASQISTSPLLREVLIEPQRQMAKTYGSCVAEGRDMGTVIFPKAEHKFFFEASATVRAKRRQKELPHASFESILKDIQDRDQRERDRDVAPLIPAPDAVIVDTSNKTLGQVLDFLLSKLEWKV